MWTGRNIGCLCVDRTERMVVVVCGPDGTSEVVWTGLNVPCLCVDWTECAVLMCGLD